MWEDPNKQLAFAPDILICGNAARFNRSRFDVSTLRGLQAPISEGDGIATSGVTSYATSLLFAVLDPLWHECHRQTPLRYTRPN